MKKRQNMPVWLGSTKWFWPSIFLDFAEPSKRQSKTQNTYCWLSREFDWSRWVSVSSLPPICSPSLGFMRGLEKSKQVNLDVRNIFAENHWRCSQGLKQLAYFRTCVSKLGVWNQDEDSGSVNEQFCCFCSSSAASLDI